MSVKRQTPAIRGKVLTKWITDNEQQFVGNEQFGVLKAVSEYVKGEKPLEALLIELSLADSNDELKTANA